MAGGGHLECSKITFDRISGHFRSIGHNGCLKFTFTTAILAISDRYKSCFFPVAILDVRKSLLIVFLAILDPYGIFIFNFWENGRRQPFWSHFWPFQIDRVSAQKSGRKTFNKSNRSIGHNGCLKFTFTIAILAISDRYRSSFFSSGHFGCQKITFDRLSGHFRSIGHFGCPKFTFDRISGHFRSIRNLIFLFKFLTKWPTAAILDVWK